MLANIFRCFYFLTSTVSPTDLQILQNFIEWFGILLSVLLALMIVQVWTKSNTVEALIDREADALVSLIRFTKFLDKPEIFEALASPVSEYCVSLMRPKLSYKELTKDSKAHVDKIFSQVLNAAQITDKQFVIKEIIKHFDDACDARGDREVTIKERMPGALWFMMIFTSMIWLLDFVWLVYQDVGDNVADFILFTTSFTVIGLLYISKDIDNPMSGISKARFTPFKQAFEEITQMRELEKPRIIKPPSQT